MSMELPEGVRAAYKAGRHDGLFCTARAGRLEYLAYDVGCAMRKPLRSMLGAAAVVGGVGLFTWLAPWDWYAATAKIHDANTGATYGIHASESIRARRLQVVDTSAGQNPPIFLAADPLSDGPCLLKPVELVNVPPGHAFNGIAEDSAALEGYFSQAIEAENSRRQKSGRGAPQIRPSCIPNGQ